MQGNFLSCLTVGLVHYHLHHLPPIWLVCPSEKIGRYSAIMIVTTTTPIITRMIGSISDSAAVKAVCTSSSKNSATEFSICGSAPVDSPTSIISIASSGNTFVDSRLDPNPFPPRPVSTDRSTAPAIWRESIDRAAVSSEGTSGKPPDNSVESVLANNPTWYLTQTGPNSGNEMRTLSMKFAPESV